MTGTITQPGQGNTYLVMGDLYTILATKENTGAYNLSEVFMQPQGFIPPHFHDEDEAHYLLDGEVEYQIDGKTISATPGTFIHISRGQVHSFKNIGLKPAKFLFWATLAGGEQFLAEIGQRVQPTNEEEKQNLLGKVNPEEIEKAMTVAVTDYGIKFVVPNSN
jgi:quercetin dioxygenase-like cupin family protein